MLKLRVGYPSREEERLVLDRMAAIAAKDQSTTVSTVATPDQIVERGRWWTECMLRSR